MFFLPADMRISDNDREAVVELLKRHYAVGRLSDSELSSRIDAAYAARYESQLERLIWDLPELSPERALARRPIAGALAPAAALGGLAIGSVAVASLLPPELWAMLLPLVVMLVFTVAPLAIPILAVLWFMRGGRPHRPAPRGGR
jgi:uncharacterized protein DUF1707